MESGAKAHHPMMKRLRDSCLTLLSGFVKIFAQLMLESTLVNLMSPFLMWSLKQCHFNEMYLV